MALSTLKYSLTRAPADIQYALILTLIMSLGGALVLASIPVGLFDKASAVVSFGLLLLPYLLFTSRHFLEWLRERTAKSRFAFPAMLLAVYVLYGLGPGRLRIPESLLIPAYLGFPILFASLAARRGDRPNRYDLLAIAFLYLPIEMAALARAWRPAEAGIPSPSHPFSQLLGMNLALFCFMAVRPLAGIGFTFRLQKRDVVQALIAFAWFFPVALVFGTMTGFVPFEPHLPDPALVLPVVLGVSLMVALPEEVLFRGLLQNLLQRAASTLRGRVAALVVASVVFGCSHLNNHPLFDWRYVTIASVAGIAYGTVYNRTGKVTAAAITHALVDVVWRLCF
ncbi:MAG: CPBP family intramembrane glutamic endopeptidase [Candidatus Polarisedimenticolia bacterium]